MFHRTEGAHVIAWNAFRTFGPLLRFDPHPPGRRGTDLATCQRGRPLRPRSLYAAGKVAQEHFALAWAESVEERKIAATPEYGVSRGIPGP